MQIYKLYIYIVYSREVVVVKYTNVTYNKIRHLQKNSKYLCIFFFKCFLTKQQNFFYVFFVHIYNINAR